MPQRYDTRFSSSPCAADADTLRHRRLAASYDGAYAKRGKDIRHTMVFKIKRDAQDDATDYVRAA